MQKVVAASIQQLHLDRFGVPPSAVLSGCEENTRLKAVLQT
jgi:hypothetical protein